MGLVVPHMWNLLRPGIEPTSPAFAGWFLITTPPGKSSRLFFKMFWNGHSDQCECLAHWTFDLSLSNKSSVGKESTCNAGDLGLIPGLGYSGLENSMGYIVDGVTKSWTRLSKFHFRASLVAQLVKSLPGVQETWVWSLGQEDPLEKKMATHSSILAWRIPWTEAPGRLQSMWSQESDMI